MKWLTNHHPDERYIAVGLNETSDHAIQRQRQWLKGKVIGEPQATASYTVEQLKAQGYVGVYLPDAPVEEIASATR